MSVVFAEGDAVERVTDGQRGVVVAEGDGLVVKIDRKIPVFDAVSPSRWKHAPKRVPLGSGQIARIQYVALAALRQARGEYGIKDWTGLRDSERIGLESNPPLDTEQKALWAAIGAALKGGTK